MCQECEKKDYRKRIILGITGASGSILGLRMLEILHELNIETHLIITSSGKLTANHETGLKPPVIEKMASVAYSINDIGASISSGSFKTLGMMIIPCSMKSLAEIANGVTSNLLSRAADVVLKERRRLVLVPRESPLHLGHLRNMISITEMGGIIFPPVPAFYIKPNSIDDIINHMAGRILDLFDIEFNKTFRWKGMRVSINPNFPENSE